VEILFLGTSAAEGWPGLFCTCNHCSRAAEAGGKNIRTRPSILVDGSILIDPGPDLHHHVLTYKLCLADLGGIVVTHAHLDHLAAGEFHFTIPPFSHRDMDRPLPIWGNAEALEWIRQAVRCDDDQEIRRGFALDLHLARPAESFRIGTHTITPLLADHAQEQQCLFYHLESNGQTYLQANDTGYFPDETWEWLEGRTLDAVSLDCTNGRLDGRQGHMGIDAVIEVVERLGKQGQLAPSARAIATHFSHNGGLLHHELEAALNPRGIEAAYDGMRVVIGQPRAG
jgi:phosphoribosyl 1,2-cyclic phosphate phosphodiesterase